jgi:hypothetical protein
MKFMHTFATLNELVNFSQILIYLLRYITHTALATLVLKLFFVASAAYKICSRPCAVLFASFGYIGETK